MHGLYFSKKHKQPFTLPYKLSLSWREINKGLYEGLEGFTVKALKYHRQHKSCT